MPGSSARALHAASSVLARLVRGNAKRRSPPAAAEQSSARDELRAGLEHVLGTALAECHAPRVVVIAPGKASMVRRWIRELRPQARVTVVAADLEGAERHLALAAATPIDLLVDRSGRAGTPGRLASLIRYVRPGGALLGKLKARLRTDTDARADYETRVHDKLGPAIARLILLERWVLVVGALAREPIIREAEAPALLASRPDLGRVLGVRPGVHVAARGTRRMNRTDQKFPVSEAWTTPPLTLREYHDAVSAPGQVVRVGGLVMPESFRHVFRPRVKNKWLAPRPMQLFVDPARTTLPASAEPVPEGGPEFLAGSYFHLDNELRGHFGHTTTEMLAKVWGWRAAREADPAVKALLHANTRDVPAEWELALLEAAGVPREDLVYTRQPVQVERLVGATPMFGNPRYAHPDLVGIWAEIADRLEVGASIDVPERIFVGRRPGGWRECVNAAEVEELFEGLGYTVVYPEDHSLADQVRLFRQTRAIAGFAGSGMFGLMWTAEPKPVVLIASEAYPGRNEFLIAGLLGHDLAVAWSPAELRDPDTGRRRRGVEAPFRVDLERDGDFLREAARSPH